MPNVFYVKNKPQGADIIDIVLKYNRVFIGYPAWRDGVERNPQNIKDALFDMHQDDFTKNDLERNLTRAQKNGTFRHIKYAKKVEQGDFVIVPRVGKGECYIGKIESSFEIDVNLTRHEKYLKLRRDQNIDSQEIINGEKVYSHLGDVIQSWKVERFEPIPFPVIPRWISYRLLSRNTIGWIYDKLSGELNVYKTTKKLYNGEYKFDNSPTNRPEVIIKRLYERTTPNELEVMITSLMRLEYPDLIWTHTGGSGDGGADGLGMIPNDSNEIKTIIQCKWMSNNFKPIAGELKHRLDNKNSDYPSLVIATLLSNIDGYKESNKFSYIKWLDARAIASLLLKYPDSDFSKRLNISVSPD